MGVLLGRVARLNSWDTIVEPDSTIARALDTLTWRGSPIVLFVLFAAIWIGHATTRVLASAAAIWVNPHRPRGLRSAAS